MLETERFIFDETALLSEVKKALITGNFKSAIINCRNLNQAHPENFSGWYCAGQIHIALKKYQAGLVSTQRALALCADEPRILLQRVECLFMLQDFQAAKALVTQLAKINTNPTQLAHLSSHEILVQYDKTGMFLSNLNCHELALTQYQLATKRFPSNAQLFYNTATTLRFLGSTRDAIQALKQCLVLNPLHYEALGLKTSLVKQTTSHNELEPLKQALANPKLAAEGKINLHYALAKTYDDMSEPARSFSALQTGAQLRRKQLAYDVAADEAIMTAIQTHFSQDFIEQRQGKTGSTTQEPIFIVGLPRTGTTLVERILSSHSQVHAAGELDVLGKEVIKLASEHTGQSLSALNAVAASTHIDFELLAKNYLSGSRHMTTDTQHFIDKLPFNYLYLGLIHLAMPHAKIIHVTRHPMAACYAIYKQLFRDAYPFSYDLTDLGRYYIAYHNLMRHWYQVLPGNIYTVHYEQMVDHTEAETKRLLAQCGLDWQPECLAFHANQQAATTASASQVRQPIYRSSLTQWRQYEEYLAPLAEQLQQAGIQL